MSFQDTWSDDDPWSPNPRFPDPVVRFEPTRADRWTYRGAFMMLGLVGAFIITLAILSAIGYFGPSYRDRCAHAGGQVVGGDTCVRTGSVVKVP